MQLRMEGFLVGKWRAQMPAGIERMAAWLRDGKVVARETIVTGFEHVPAAMIAMLSGDNTGKMVVRL